MALIIALGDPVIIHVLVLSPGTLLTATGAVILRDGRHTVAVGQLDTNGHFVFNISSAILGAGVHEMTVYYAGDQNFAPGLSNILEVDIVTLAPSITTITPSATNVVYGTSITFSSNVTGSMGTATGTVSFFDGINVIDTETLIAGSTVSLPVVLSAGMHAVIATYSGDTLYLGSSSFPALITVSLYGSSTTIFSNNNPSNYGNSVTLTATVIVPVGGVATGIVTFFDGITSIGVGTVSANSASLMLSTLNGGSHNITAQYSGDSNFSSSTSPILVQVVNALPTNTTLISSANPITYGMSTLLSATVSSSFSIPSGTVTFYDGVNPIGTVSLDVTGLATLNIPLFNAGTRPITAQYNGNSNYLTSTSNTVSEVINKANTVTTLISSAPTSPSGVNITFTATVVGSNNGLVTGTVQFKDGAGNLGSPVTVNGSGVATFSTSSLPQGVHNITAVYSGDSNNNTSTSNTVVETITAQLSMTVLVSNLNPANYGVNVTFTATVSGALGTPTGTVQFYDGVSPIGPVVPISSGIGSYSTSALIPAVHSITAVYSGDITYSTSTSNIVFETINKLNPTFGITSSVNPSTYGNNVIFFATASGTQGTPTGSVQFVIDGTNFGGTVTLVAGSAQTSSSTLTAGTHTIVANYSGDTIYNVASASLSPIQTVNKANTSSSISSSINPTAIGQATIFSSTVTSVTTGTPTGTVQFKDSASNIGAPATLTSGTGSISYSGLAVGGHSITSVYSGDANFNTSTSIILTQNVTASPTVTTLMSNTNPSIYGQSVTFTAIVTGSSPTGTITFKDGVTTIATRALPLNTASITILLVGSHSITAVYGGDSNNAGSTSNTVTQVVNKASTTITPFTASPSSGETVFSTFSLSATVNPQFTVNPEPSGNVTFSIVSPFTNLGSATLNGSSPDVATLAGINIPTAGTYQLQANYPGDSNFNGSSQFISGFVVSKFTPAITQVFSHNPTGGFPNTVDSVHLTGDGIHNVTGTVTLIINGITTALSGGLVHQSGVDQTGGSAIFITGTSFGGSGHEGYKTVQASYAGSSSYNAVTSSIVSYLYQRATPTITITISGSPSYYPAPPPSTDITITITVSGSFPENSTLTGAPTGTVSLNVYGTATGNNFNTGPLTLSFGSTSVLISNTFGTPTPGYSPISNGIYNDLTQPAANGTETFTTSALYNGDDTYTPGGINSGSFEIYGPAIN
jgi:hypothetical protein